MDDDRSAADCFADGEVGELNTGRPFPALGKIYAERMSAETLPLARSLPTGINLMCVWGDRRGPMAEGRRWKS